MTVKRAVVVDCEDGPAIVTKAVVVDCTFGPAIVDVVVTAEVVVI